MRELQRELDRRGYEVGDIDGRVGDRLQAALRDYQEFDRRGAGRLSDPRPVASIASPRLTGLASRAGFPPNSPSSLKVRPLTAAVGADVVRFRPSVRHACAAPRRCRGVCRRLDGAGGAGPGRRSRRLPPAIVRRRPTAKAARGAGRQAEEEGARLRAGDDDARTGHAGRRGGPADLLHRRRSATASPRSRPAA